MTEAEFKLFRDLVYAESGMYLRSGKKEFLENRIVKRMSAVNVTTSYWYYRFIKDGDKAELINLLDLLTINETSFFRNKPQIELLRKKILPEVIEKKERASMKELRIWSAGCSTGEEPYTIAMIVKEVLPPGVWNVSIFASDLSLTALESASRGVYNMNKVKNDMDPYYVEKYLEVIGGSYIVKDELKEMIVFDFHNMKYDHGLKGLDIILCRNVMIYFDEEEQKRLVNKFYENINDEGYLLLGHTESLQGWDAGFEFVHDRKGTAYRKCKKELV
ncbi:MAG: protein-glutamate O-methyltransferase CheR [Thermodesulfovibrionales bacterium]